MKVDHPRLTAFALGELPPAEQAEIEQELRSDREIAAEVAETHEIARILREGLGVERGSELASHQRDAIFREAELVQKERSLSGGFSDPSSTEAFSPLIVPRSAWWNRPGPWQAIAACTVAGFAAYALFVNVGGHWKAAGLSDSGEIVVQVPADIASHAGSVREPNLISPQELSAQGGTASAGFNSLNTASPVPKLNGISPDARIDTQNALTGSQPPQPALSPDASPELPKPRGPRVVDAKNPASAELRAAATIARAEKKPGAVVEDNVSAYLKDQGLRAGSTYEEFLRVFEPIPDAPGHFKMIKSPSIEVTAEFMTPQGQPLTSPPTAESRVKRISKSYLE